jgi:hypothetical protein
MSEVKLRQVFEDQVFSREGLLERMASGSRRHIQQTFAA